MQHPAQNGSGRREERVPLEALVELRSDDSDEALEADGLNVSIGGLALRATFMPPLGAQLECRFQCPPGGTTVSAHGEVVWSEWQASEQGASFGLRFVELDTKSATALRRYVSPGRPSELTPDRLRAATLSIDGLGAPVEAELKLADETRIVLEQQLTFLQLGRGVEVSVLGRGTERGRIASVELRHTHFDVPTLVFGVLLDDAPERIVKAVASGVAPLFSRSSSSVPPRASSSAPPRPAMSIPPSLPSASSRSASSIETELPHEYVEQLPRDTLFSDAEPPFESAHFVDERYEEQGYQDTRYVDPHEQAAREQDAALDGFDGTDGRDGRDGRDEPDEEEELAHDRDHARGELARVRPLGMRVRLLPGHFKARWRALLRQLGALGKRIEPALREQAESLDLPDTKTRILLRVARVRALGIVAWSRMRGTSTAQVRGKRPPTLRMQRTTLPGIGGAPTVESGNVRTSQRTRIVAGTLAILAVGVATYVLAPRSGADRLRDDEQTDQSAEAAASEQEPVAASTADPTEQVPSADDEPPALAAAPVLTEPFGDLEVPNGRTFTLRMNGPVKSIEGETREDGFTVRIPRRQAVDGARSIAQAHRSIARALILNRGGYAELTIEFAPGVKPRYQVQGKDSTLEITLERPE